MREKQQLNKDAVVASGLWKFGEKIAPDELVALAKEWAAADTEGRYLDLYVRKCSRTQHGIGFMFVLRNSENDQNAEDYEKFFNRMTDMLKRKFGNDLVGWDISAFTHIII